MPWTNIGSLRGPSGVTTLSGATDYDNSTPATNNQAILWVASGSKFKPVTITPALIGAASTSDLTDLAPKASPTFTGSIRFNGRRYDSPVGLSNGAPVAIDASLGNLFWLTANANRTLAVPTNGIDGQMVRLQIAADATNRTITLTTGAGGYLLTTGVASSYVLPAGKMSFITLECIGTSPSSNWHVVALAVQA